MPAARLGRVDARSLTALCLLMLALVVLGSGAPQLAPPSGGGGEVSPADSYADLPLAFEPNAGRYSHDLDYVANSDGGTIALGRGGAVLTPADRDAEPIRVSLAGAATTAPAAIDRLPGLVNDLRGDDRAGWTSGIPTFSRVRYENVYPGIDLDYHGQTGTLEYDFRLAPGADPKRIAIGFGGEPARVASNGGLVVGSGRDAIRQAPPVAFQPTPNGREPVSSRFTIDDRGRAGFALGTYDHNRPLVIDPLVLTYSTYLGGNGAEEAKGIAVDVAGSAFITGQTASTDFDTVNPIEGNAASTDVFVSKLNPAGSALIYSTYLGGNGFETARAIAIDSAGAAYVTGQTNSTDFNTVNAIEGVTANTDVFVSKLNPAGSALTYSTYLGGGANEFARSITVDNSGAAFIAGTTDSADYDTTAGAFQTIDTPFQDGFVSKLTPAGSALAYSTYLGGDGTEFAQSIAVDGAGSAYVAGSSFSSDFPMVGSIEGNSTGYDGTVSKLNPAGSALVYSTYLGGNSTDDLTGIAVDASGAAYVAGGSSSTDFNLVGEIEGNSTGGDVTVSKINPAGNALVYSTYLGGDGDDEASDLALDPAGAVHIAGETLSTDFDTLEAFEGNSAGADVFMSKLTPAGDALTYSTYLGGSGTEPVAGASGSFIALDPSGAAYLAGDTDSTDFDAVGPIEGDSAGIDAFISKLTFTPPSDPPVVDPPVDDPPAGDTTAPDTSIAGKKKQRSRFGRFTVRSTEAGSTFECRVDRGKFVPCQAKFKTRRLNLGRHTVFARAIDEAGNVDASPEAQKFKLKRKKKRR